MSQKQRRMLIRIIVALALFALDMVLAEGGFLDAWFGEEAGRWVELLLFLPPYFIAGYDVLWKAVRNIGHGQVFDENFLMSVATLGAFALVAFPQADAGAPEGVAVMLFYQVGELFQSYAVDKSRKSISEMMEIAPEYANVVRGGELVQVDPYEVEAGQKFVVKPGERVPLDGVVVEGRSQLNTAALTGESVPREAAPGSEVVSGCINLSGTLTVRASKAYEDSTVSRILELVENAAEKKARTENFITRFARYYTPIVVGLAVLLSVVPSLFFGQPWWAWVERGLTFLVVSCPCALVISVPLSFFGGIGGASRIGVLVKGSNYLEALAKVDTVVFDKTGTLTSGVFEVVAVHNEEGVDEARLLEVTACAEAFSNHPIAASVREAYGKAIDPNRVCDVEEVAGMGVQAKVDGRSVMVGNDKLLERLCLEPHSCTVVGTVLHVAVDGRYVGHITIADVVKPDSRQAIAALRKAGVNKTVILTGDRKEVALAVGEELGVDEVRCELLPQDKVFELEHLLEGERNGQMLAFVGDGINDAPVLTRADVGIAMGALGSDAAIEAADVVLMDDNPLKIAHAMRVARATLSIVRQNIVFALGVKFVVLALAAVGLANMWMAVFADVGVAIIAILNAMRAMIVKRDGR